MAKKPEVWLVRGRPLRMTVRRSARARHLRLNVSTRRGVVAVLPNGASRAELTAMVHEAADWLAAQADRHGVWDGPRRREWRDRDVLTLLGEPITLVITPLAAGRRRPRATLTDGQLRLDLPAADLLDPRPALERWLRRFAGRELRRRTALWSERTGLAPQRVIVGERTSRWGSCSSRGTLSFCYRLVLAPAEVVDAVVVHELCHLRHRNHGPRFKALVRAEYPDHDRQMDWLAAHGHELEV